MTRFKDMLKKKIIFTPASNIISHTGRCVSLARELKKRGHEIILAGSPRYLQNPQIVGEDEFGYYELKDFLSEEAMESLRTMKKTYTRKTILEYINSELVMLRKLRPHMVITDFRLTMSISARLQNIPLIALLNARWVPQYFNGTYNAPDSHPLPFFAKRILGKRMANFLWPHLIKLIQRYKLSPFPWALRKYHLEIKRYLPEILIGDYNLILDTRRWGPTRNLPQNFKQVGPIIWSPELTMPDRVKELGAAKRSVYVTMGSTGEKNLFGEIIKSFLDTDYHVVVSTGGQIEIEGNMIAKNIHLEKYLPGEKVMEEVDMVICHGGNQTVYQAIKAGTPCLVIATHLDQEWAGEEIEAHGAGIFLTMVRVMAKPSLIMDSTRKMFDNMEKYQKNMEGLQEDLLKYDGLKDAVLNIEGFMQESFGK